MANVKIIKCWGDDIQIDGIETKKFLSYVVHKKEFSFIKNCMHEDIELNKFDYAEIILDQESNELILDFYSDGDFEEILNLQDVGIFSIVLSQISLSS